jgi:lysophospholipase L1-like esterase
LHGAIACESTDTTEGGDVSAVAPTFGDAGTSDGTTPSTPSTPDASVAAPFDAGTLPGAIARDAGTTPVKDAAAGDAQVAAGDAQVAAGDAQVPVTSTPQTSGFPKPKCMKKDSQLVVVGDSYINWISHSFPEDIKKESGQTWRMEAVGGYSMGSGGIGSIPQEFYDSIAKDPDAHTVLMDGGGNDVLVPDFSKAFFYDCTNKGASKESKCQMILEKALETARQFRDKAAAAGIRNVVYFFYPHVPANTILSGDDPADMLDYALPKVRAFCDDMFKDTAGKTRCTFIDMIPIFKGHDDWFNEDIHPNSKGSAGMAKEIWRVMSEQCIGQKGPKDCCEP